MDQTKLGDRYLTLTVLHRPNTRSLLSEGTLSDGSLLWMCKAADTSLLFQGVIHLESTKDEVIISVVKLQ